MAVHGQAGPERHPSRILVLTRARRLAQALTLGLAVVACDPAPAESPAAGQPGRALGQEQARQLDRQLDQQLDRELQEVVEAFDLVGLAVILLAGGEVVYEGYAGEAVVETGRALGPESVVRIASISKTVTALALMQLQEQGAVELDADVSRYLGWELRNPAHPDAPLTLRMLLGHTSGIRDGEGYGAFTRAMVERRLPLRELFEAGGAYASDDMFAAHPPGAFFSYSNAAWGVIASVVEAVSGERFDRYTRNHILDPLGMTASFNPADLPAADYAALYRHRDDAWAAQVDLYLDEAPVDRAWEGYVPGTNGLLYAPQGGLRMTSPALARLALALMHGGAVRDGGALDGGALDGSVRDGSVRGGSVRGGVRIVEAATLDEMKAPHWSYDGSNGDTWDDFWMAYGLGLHLVTNREGKDVIFPDRTMFGHAGIAYGLLSDMYVDAKTGSGVIFITNGSARDYTYADASAFYEVEAAVFDRLFPVLRDLEARRGATPRDAAPRDAATPGGEDR